jgi:hypothetical protein
MGFFDGNTLSSRATAQLSYDGDFDVADQRRLPERRQLEPSNKYTWGSHHVNDEGASEMIGNLRVEGCGERS